MLVEYGTNSENPRTEDWKSKKFIFFLQSFELALDASNKLKKTISYDQKVVSGAQFENSSKFRKLTKKNGFHWKMSFFDFFHIKSIPGKIFRNFHRKNPLTEKNNREKRFFFVILYIGPRRIEQVLNDIIRQKLVPVAQLENLYPILYPTEKILYPIFARKKSKEAR